MSRLFSDVLRPLWRTDPELRPEGGSSLLERERRPAAPVAGFGEQLRASTQSLRAEALDGPFFQTLFFGGWGRSVGAQYLRAQQHVAYLRQLQVIYGALEAGLRDKAPGVQAMPELFRSVSIARDLTYFSGEPAWSDAHTGRAAFLWRERIRELSQEAPQLLAAHGYARIVLDLEPGPVLSRQLTSAFELEDGFGTALYDAVAAEALPAFRQRVLTWLDGLTADLAEREELIAEAGLALRLQGQLGRELLSERL